MYSIADGSVSYISQTRLFCFMTAHAREQEASRPHPTDAMYIAEVMSQNPPPILKMDLEEKWHATLIILAHLSVFLSL